MPIILINDVILEAVQYFSNQDAPKGVIHCGRENIEHGHAHINGFGTVNDGDWVLYHNNEITDIVTNENFNNGKYESKR